MRPWIVFATLAILSISTDAQARGDQEPCAWVIIDESGDTWINGEPAALEALEGLGCVEETQYVVLAPEFGTSAISVFRTRTELRKSGVDVKYFLPSVRHFLLEIFGFDTVADCADLTQYVPPPIVPPNTLEFQIDDGKGEGLVDSPPSIVIRGSGTQVSVQTINDEGVVLSQFRDIVALEEVEEDYPRRKQILFDESVSWGIVDYVADAMGAYDNRTPISVSGADPKDALILDSDDDFHTPLPRVVARRVVVGTDGEATFLPPSYEDLNRASCPYAQHEEEDE